MIFLLSAILFLTIGTQHIIADFHFYEFEPNCVAPCTEDSLPNVPGNPPCFCTPDNFPQGCQMAPCGPGDTSDGTYTCQCTEFFQPYLCVTLRCDNGTRSDGSSCPSSSHSSSYYPSQSYPTPSYYPSQSYPTQSYGPAYYPAPFYPTPSYPSPLYGYSQPSYSPYPSQNLCNNYCVCEPYLPADCTDDSIPPIIGGPPCACNSDGFVTGCTLKPCPSVQDGYPCECTPTNAPYYCNSPRCSSS